MKIEDVDEREKVIKQAIQEYQEEIKHYKEEIEGLNKTIEHLQQRLKKALEHEKNLQQEKIRLEKAEKENKQQKKELEAKITANELLKQELESKLEKLNFEYSILETELCMSEHRYKSQNEEMEILKKLNEKLMAKIREERGIIYSKQRPTPGRKNKMRHSSSYSTELKGTGLTNVQPTGPSNKKVCKLPDKAWPTLGRMIIPICLFS